MTQSWRAFYFPNLICLTSQKEFACPCSRLQAENSATVTTASSGLKVLERHPNRSNSVSGPLSVWRAREIWCIWGEEREWNQFEDSDVVSDHPITNVSVCERICFSGSITQGWLYSSKQKRHQSSYNFSNVRTEYVSNDGISMRVVWKWHEKYCMNHQEVTK